MSTAWEEAVWDAWIPPAEKGQGVTGRAVNQDSLGRGEPSGEGQEEGWRTPQRRMEELHNEV